MQSTKAKWFLVFKWLIAFTSVFYIAYHISSRINTISVENIFSVLHQNNSTSKNLILLVFLMILNWMIESFKWKTVVAEAEEISLLKSLRAVLTGLTVSFYSPNRTGEFIGRVMHLQPQNRVRASLLTFVGSICQLTITLQVGLIAAMFYLFPKTSNLKLATLNLIVLVVSFILLFNTTKWMERLKDFKWLYKYAQHFNVLTNYSTKKLSGIYALSVLRYAVFAFQFYLLLNICNINLPEPTMIINIGLSFMLTSVIPSVALGELGVRGSVNLSLFSANHTHDEAVFVASFLLWLINLAVPALIGALCSFYIKWNSTSAK